MSGEIGEVPSDDKEDSVKTRVLESKVLLVLFLISSIWTVSMFIAPFTIEPGTVTDLEGNANRLDFNDLWNEMPLYPRIIYYLGDAECHQISERTIYLNGNQMPVCARDVSIFIFITLGLLVGMLTKRNYYISAGLLSSFPKRVQNWVNRTIGAKWFAILFVLLCFAPVVIDGGIQLFTDYESTNLIRFLTGIPAGFMGGLLIAILIKSVKATKEYEREWTQAQES